MTKLPMRAAALAASTALVGAVLAAPSAASADASACADREGVTVVVDTGETVETRCAAGSPPSALDALDEVADVVQVQTQPGFVCRIDGFPEGDACVRTPPADAYWAFFHAPAGSTWTYSREGAATYAPPPGSVLGFRFGAGGLPPRAEPHASAPASPGPGSASPTTLAALPTSADDSGGGPHPARRRWAARPPRGRGRMVRLEAQDTMTGPR